MNGKRILTIILMGVMIFALTACGKPDNQTGNSLSADVNTETTEVFASSSVADNSTESESKNRSLKMTVDGQEISVTLYDTPAANALYDMLPLELDFEDYNNIEKISYLTQKLPTAGEPDGCDPAVGDLCLYAPWGNLSIFYQDFRYSTSLIKLGHIDSGMELISGQKGNFKVKLEVK